MAKERTNLETEEMQTGEYYIMELTSGAVISGRLIMKSEILTENGIRLSYRIAIGNSKVIDLLENEIAVINIVESPRKDKLEYLREFEREYGVKCFDNTGNLLSNTMILENIVATGIWDKLSEEKKEEFIGQIHLEIRPIVRIINIWDDYRKRN